MPLIPRNAVPWGKLIVFLVILLFFLKSDLVQLSNKSTEEAVSSPVPVVHTPKGPPSLDEKMDQSDPQLIRAIQDWFLEKPPQPIQPLRLTMVKNISHPMLLGQFGQAKWVENYFKEKKGGFFLECGAADGETLSNTLLLEMKHQWSGVLIEANTDTYKGIRDRARNVYSLNVCLSPSPPPASLHFQVLKDNLMSYLAKGAVSAGAVRTQCLPLYSILLAIGNPTVHYLSLDVEGSEEGVLKSVPWDKVDIKVLTVEVSHSSASGLKDVMSRGGYTALPDTLGEDLVFIKNGFHP